MPWHGNSSLNMTMTDKEMDLFPFFESTSFVLFSEILLLGHYAPVGWNVPTLAIYERIYRSLYTEKFNLSIEARKNVLDLMADQIFFYQEKYSLFLMTKCKNHVKHYFFSLNFN